MDRESTVNALVTEAVSTIEAGGVAIVPADTVYAFAGDATARGPVERVYEIKDRPRGKPFGLITSNSKIQEIGSISKNAESLIRAFWPGPLSMLIRASDRIPDWFTASDRTLLVLTAQNEIMSSVIDRCSVPIFTTTCNKSGDPEAISVEQLEPFREIVDYVAALEGFEFVGTTTTMVDAVREPPRLIRDGALPLEEIQRVLPDISRDLSGKIG